VRRAALPESRGGQPAPHGEAARLAFAYVALFGMMGIQLPYWPVWLAHRGMEPDEIGLLLGVFTWARLAAPWTGSWVDRRGSPHRLAAVLSAATLACMAAFALADSFAPLLLLSALSGLTLAPVLPLVDGIAVGAAAARRIDYGRVRLWGSATFVFASSLGGLALQGRSAALVLPFMIAASAALTAASLFLPRAPARRPAPSDRAGAGAGAASLAAATAAATADAAAAVDAATFTAPAPAPAPASGPALLASLRSMLARPRMPTFLAAIGCMQGSHAVLYGFGTRYWQSIGIPESTIGWMWAWGVIAEVALFAVSQRAIARLGPVGMLSVAGLGGVIRWPLLARVESVPILFALQTLHATTFAAMHLGAMTWIRDTIDAPAVQRATGLYVAVGSGIALGLGMPLAGLLYGEVGGGAYFAMAVSSALGLFFALRLRPTAAAPARS